MSHYVLRGGIEGKKRLEVLARVMWPTTSRLLERAGLRRGMTCLDLGCGGGDVTIELGRRVGPEGRVIGVDIDRTKLDLARATASHLGLGNIQFRDLNVSDWREETQYDFIYCRFLLTHLSDPLDVLCSMRRALRPGGIAVVEDVDFSGSFCQPRCAGYEQYVRLYRMVVARRGGDADIGPKLYGLFLDSAEPAAGSPGWQEVNLDLVQPAFFSGEGKEIALLTLVNITEAVLQEGLDSAAELQEAIDDLARFTSDARTIVGMPRVFQVWARCPGRIADTLHASVPS